MTIDERESYTLPSGYTFGTIRKDYYSYGMDGVGEPGALAAYDDIVTELFSRVELSGFLFTEKQASIYMYNAAYELMAAHRGDFAYTSTMDTFCSKMYHKPSRYRHDMHEVYDALLRGIYGELEDWNEGIYKTLKSLETIDETESEVYRQRFNKHVSLSSFRHACLEYTHTFIDKPTLPEWDRWKLQACLYALETLLPQRF